MGKRKGGKKSKDEGARRSRSKSKSESKSEDVVKKPELNKEEKNDKKGEDQPKEETMKTAINQDVLAKVRNDSECGSLIVECGFPAKNALQLLAEIDDNQEQSSQKNALKLLDEVDSVQKEVDKEEEKVPESNPEPKPDKKSSQKEYPTLEENALDMEGMTLDSDDEEESNPTKSEQVKKEDESISETKPEPKVEQKSLQKEYPTLEENALDMEGMTLDSDEENVTNPPKPEPAKKQEIKEEAKVPEPKTEPKMEQKPIQKEYPTLEENALDMEGMTLDSDEEEDTNPPKPEQAKKQEINEEAKVPEPKNDTKTEQKSIQKEYPTLEENALDMEGMTLDSDEEDETNPPEQEPAKKEETNVPEPKTEPKIEQKLIQKDYPTLEENALDMEGMTLDSDDEEESKEAKSEPESKTKLEIKPEHKPEAKISQKEYPTLEENALDMEGMTLDSDDEEESKPAKSEPVPSAKIDPKSEPKPDAKSSQKEYPTLEENALDMEGMTLDSDDEEESKPCVPKPEPEIKPEPKLEVQTNQKEYPTLEENALDMEGMTLDSDDEEESKPCEPKPEPETKPKSEAKSNQKEYPTLEENALDMEGMTLDSDDEEESKPCEPKPEPETKPKSEAKSNQKEYPTLEVNALDMDGMTLISDEEVEKEVEKNTIENTNSTFDDEIEILNEAEEKTQKSSSTSSRKKMSANNERTFIMLKPDTVHRGLVGEIIMRFENKGFKLVAMKMMHASTELLEQHYSDLSKKPFFPDLVAYMASGPVVPMVWEGLNVVKTGRVMLGETNPAASAPGTIRGDLCIQVGRNICHGSDAVESAKNEIALWFKEEELVSWDPVAMEWVYEDFKPFV